jgi:hypothetical protein
MINLVHNLVFQEATTNGIVSLKFSPMSLLADLRMPFFETFCHLSLGASIRVSVEKTLVFWYEMLQGDDFPPYLFSSTKADGGDLEL